jgi:hypothetical protein
MDYNPACMRGIASVLSPPPSLQISFLVLRNYFLKQENRIFLEND